MRYAMPQETHARIFGNPDSEERRVGKSRRCKSCGDWHSLSKPWPHNCRPPQGPRQHLAAPLLAPAFDSFVAQPGSDVTEVIGSRNDKREYMKRNGLVEHATGVADTSEWARHRDEIADIVDDIKMVDEMDPDRRRAEFGATQMVEGGSLAEGTEIEVGSEE